MGSAQILSKKYIKVLYRQAFNIIPTYTYTQAHIHDTAVLICGALRTGSATYPGGIYTGPSDSSWIVIFLLYTDIVVAYL